MLDFTHETAPHELAFAAFGVELRVCASSPELLAETERYLPPGARRVTPNEDQFPLGIIQDGTGHYLVYKGTVCVSEGHPLPFSLSVLEGQIRGHVAVLAPEITFVHAGAVEHEGRAIIFPGHSFSGKTTLTEAFIRAGATYYSDEFAVLDGDGRLHPYPKPLSIRKGETSLQSDHTVESLNGVAGVELIPVGLVLVTYYRPGAQWVPRKLSPGEAAMAVLANTVTVRQRPQEGLRAITRALEGADAYEGERGEAVELVDRVLAGDLARAS